MCTHKKTIATQRWFNLTLMKSSACSSVFAWVFTNRFGLLSVEENSFLAKDLHTRDMVYCDKIKI